MKFTIKIILLAFVLQSMQCEEDNVIYDDITQEQLNIKKQEILNYIATFSCADASSCNSIAFGAKPCGGPREYLVYPNTVNQTTLETLVNEYHEMDSAFNTQTGAVSDCMVVGPPNTVGCVNGVCTILD
jgi:hypothetical protein